MKCNFYVEPKKKGGMRYVKGENIGCRVNSRIDYSRGHAGFCEVDQPEGCWDCPLDFHHHWGSDRPSSVDTSSNSFLLFHRNHLQYDLQAKETPGGVNG